MHDFPIEDHDLLIARENVLRAVVAVHEHSPGRTQQLDDSIDGLARLGISVQRPERRTAECAAARRTRDCRTSSPDSSPAQTPVCKRASNSPTRAAVIRLTSPALSCVCQLRKLSSIRSMANR